MEKVAIVIGATGVVGRELVTQLGDHVSFSKVVVLTRRKVVYENPKIINHVVDFEHLDLAQDYFQGGDVLFSALGTTLKMAGSLEAQRRVDVDYQLQAAKLAVSSNVSEYVLVSSSGANSDSRSPYLKMKGELENLVQSLSFKRVSILRPSLLLGSRSDFRFGEKIGALLLPALCLIPQLSKYKPITGAEVASAMIRFNLKQKNTFEIYSLSDLFD